MKENYRQIEEHSKQNSKDIIDWRKSFRSTQIGRVLLLFYMHFGEGASINIFMFHDVEHKTNCLTGHKKI